MNAKQIFEKYKNKYPALEISKDTEKIILWAMDDHLKTNLVEYTDFLMDEGYCDSDVVDEGNTAIDRFLFRVK
jgi:hypothetical protein